MAQPEDFPKRRISSLLDRSRHRTLCFIFMGGNILKDQIGLTPEEVISKIMANPEVAMAFQNPGVQAAIMDCSQNPLSVAKYQNEKEVKDVFNKIAELFPGATGSS
ncbi:protein TIC 40, chloroplastic-like isoform X5 [Macadamia integrifolia]|uniref:protein TIC 40, chloroplastic-like isoform X5 n=2 Tax=Macadamia integrifolia TaxID=60698 RepID=UPI001C4FA62A|nr:protein TIC 40, chloroplastic-like isoform X5 [Macadamia integrifolia]